MEEAAARCNGELLERYSALNADFSRVSMLPQEHLERFPRCRADEPCPPAFRELDPEIPLTHVEVAHLADGSSIWVPAGLVHLGFWPRPPEPVVTLPISTGLAFNTSLEDALWSGICEVAERDAMMMSWWARDGGTEIDLCARAPSDLLARLERLEDVGLCARLFDITTDFRVPTVFCVLSGPRYPFITVGAATRDDPAIACAKALDEAVSIRVAVRGEDAKAIPSRSSFAWVEHLDDHSRLYAHPGMEHAMEFLGSGRSPVDFSSFAAGDFWAPPTTMAELRALAGDLADRWSILWADVTTPDVAPLGRTVKVLIPQMVPLSQSHSARWLATPRLAAKLGVHEPNPYPHPFA